MSAGHADDGDLIRLVDRECTAEERARLEGHLATCRPCAQRRATLERLSAAVTAALAGDRTARRAWRGGALRAAAVLLLVVAAAASAQPVRAWIAERWGDLRGLVAPYAAPEPQAVGAGTTTVRFVPTTSVFAIELAARQDAGVLTIEVSGDSTAMATVTPATPGAELTVLPAGLRIVNRPGDGASYVVRLSTGVTEVVLRIADGPVRRLVPAAGARHWTIDLNTTGVLSQ